MENFKVDSKTEVLYKSEDWKVISNGVEQKSQLDSLYKYYSLNANNIDALENNYFYLSNPKTFNDPFDCNRNLVIEQQKELNDWDYVETLNDSSNIGITSFSENGMEPLLWSHYTDSYHGFCIKLKSDFIRQVKEGNALVKKVIYSEEPASISIDLDFSKYYQFILKLSDWKYEKEWRLLFTNPSMVSNKYSFDVDNIEEISVGYNFHNPRNEAERELKERFTKLRRGKFKNIPLYTVGPKQTELKLNKIRLVDGTVEDGLEMLKQRFGRLSGKK